MKKLLSILCAVLAALVLLTFAACDNGENNGVKITYFEDDYVPKYNDVLYDSAVKWISEDFQCNNLIYGARYDDGLKPEEPLTRTFIITEREQFENIFVENIAELEVDFDSEIMIVYTFATEYVSPAYILDMNLSGNTLTVDYTIPLILEAGSAVKPFQRWFVIKLDKLEVTSAVFNYYATYYKAI